MFARKLLGVVSASLVLLGSPATSDTFETRDDIVAYLKSEIPDGDLLSLSFELGQEVSSPARLGGCYTDRTFERMSPVLGILAETHGVGLELVKEYHGIAPPGEPPCLYRIKSFGYPALTGLDIEMEFDDTIIRRIEIPLVQQDVLGIEDVDLNGSRIVRGDRCSVSFSVWFRNYNPSRFVRLNENRLRQDRQFSNLFAEEFGTWLWCLNEKYDGSVERRIWSRL